VGGYTQPMFIRLIVFGQFRGRHIKLMRQVPAACLPPALTGSPRSL